MSPIDNHLRESLSRHAADVDGGGGDRFAAVEERARALHRRRLTVMSGATAVILAGGVLGGLALTGSSDDAVIVPGDTGDATSAPPSPTSPPSPSPTPYATALPESAFLDWPYRSGDGVAAVDVAASTRPLWDGRLPNGTLVVIGQRPDAAGNVRAHAWITEEGKPSYELDGAVIKPSSTVEVSFVLPGDEYPYVLVIGDPTIGQIRYAEDGETFNSVDFTDAWALFPRTGGEGDAIEILGGDGDMDHPLYKGPIDTGPSEPDV